MALAAVGKSLDFCWK